MVKFKTHLFIADFKILSFPCNQFGSQMPQKDGEDMMCHLEKREANVGDVFKKINVNGANAAPLYKFLKEKAGEGDRVKWNFVKFLVNKEGEPVERFGSSFSPKNIAPKIDELLWSFLHLVCNHETKLKNYHMIWWSFVYLNTMYVFHRNLLFFFLNKTVFSAKIKKIQFFCRRTYCMANNCIQIYPTNFTCMTSPVLLFFA